MHPNGNKKTDHTMVLSVLGPEGNYSSSVCASGLASLLRCLNLCGKDLGLVLLGFKTYLQRGPD